MSDLNELKKRIEEKLAASKESAKHEHQRNCDYAMELAEKQRRFNERATQLMSDIVRPRLEQIAFYFENVEPADAAGHSGILFRHTRSFPVTAKLELAVSRDGPFENLVVTFDQQILPVTAQYKGHKEITFPLGTIDEQQLTAWVDDRICEFVDTYLKYKTNDGERSMDPVCGMLVVKDLATAQTDHQGTTYYFCTVDCHRKFVENPQEYLKAATA